MGETRLPPSSPLGNAEESSRVNRNLATGSDFSLLDVDGSCPSVAKGRQQYPLPATLLAQSSRAETMNPHSRSPFE